MGTGSTNMSPTCPGGGVEQLLASCVSLSHDTASPTIQNTGVIFYMINASSYMQRAKVIMKISNMILRHCTCK